MIGTNSRGGAASGPRADGRVRKPKSPYRVQVIVDEGQRAHLAEAAGVRGISVTALIRLYCKLGLLIDGQEFPQGVADITLHTSGGDRRYLIGS